MKFENFDNARAVVKAALQAAKDHPEKSVDELLTIVQSAPYNVIFLD